MPALLVRKSERRGRQHISRSKAPGDQLITRCRVKGLFRAGAPAFGQERRSTDLNVPLGYRQLTSNAFFEFQMI
jgi:hypothetical protein